MVEQLPKIVSVEALALSPAESRAFPRWYTDLLLRKRTDSVTIGDVMSFVDNFGVSSSDKSLITAMFGEPLVTLDPPQFYVFLRLAGHVLQGKQLRRELAFVASPVPKPRSILASVGTRSRDRTEMDSFMSLMTGQGGGVKKRKKRVTFDSRPPQVTEAAHRSMEELLRQSQLQAQLNLPPQMAPQPLAQIPDEPEQEREREPEPDQPIANNQFAHVNIESVLHHGQSMLPEPPAPRKTTKAGDSFIQQLTRSTQPSASPQPPPQQQSQPQQPPPPPRRMSVGAQTGISANLTGSRPANLTANLSGNLAGNMSAATLQPPMPGQPHYLSPQASGLTTQSTGQYISPQASGMQAGGLQANGLQAQGSGWQQPNYWQQQQQQQPQKLGPQSTGSLPMNVPRPPVPPNRQSLPSIQAPMQSGLQHPGIQPQVSGMPLQSQLSGMQQPSGFYPPQPSLPNMQNLQPGVQPNLHAQAFQNNAQVSPQVSGIQQMYGQAPYQPMQQQNSGMQPNTGMQFLNSVQNQDASNAYQIKPPPQYVRNGEAYNMQALRNQMPNW